MILGTTVFEHALARTSAKPLSRASGTPSSPPTSFKGQSGAGVQDGASGGVQGMCTQQSHTHRRMCTHAELGLSDVHCAWEAVVALSVSESDTSML